MAFGVRLALSRVTIIIKFTLCLVLWPQLIPDHWGSFVETSYLYPRKRSLKGVYRSHLTVGMSVGMSVGPLQYLVCSVAPKVLDLES